eukprot:TRINITY_DN6853_c0_g1_i1.p1 TRINITY_DN6853_c0_g1~~TRINITY_DN6853_c0_g1_i1.p1  ORF type:complete len:125 (+),score=9.34 TRINITY_DN6853_c0_g1_i1:105-479(+)
MVGRQIVWNVNSGKFLSGVNGDLIFVWVADIPEYLIQVGMDSKNNLPNRVAVNHPTPAPAPRSLSKSPERRNFASRIDRVLTSPPTSPHARSGAKIRFSPRRKPIREIKNISNPEVSPHFGAGN